MNMPVTLSEQLKSKPADETKMGFGTIFTDHMFVMNYDQGKGWHSPRIEPYAPLSLDPSAMCLHYAQEVFEGLKAYRGVDGNIRLFRPEENFKRLNQSSVRMSIPEIDEKIALEGLKQLVQIEKDWVPSAPDTSLYLRPFIIAVDPAIGVRPAEHYIFMIIASPSGPYYESGLDPVKIYVEKEYVRSVKGGTGVAKTGGNYASSLNSQVEAHAEGFNQVLWLDGVERKYIEEVGAMNIFFVIGDEVVTPELSGSILEGITRKSAIQILQEWGIKVSERKISIDEVIDAGKKGLLKEAFGTGTAAVISPVGLLRYEDTDIVVNNNEIGPIVRKLYDELTGIQWGKVSDKLGWTLLV